MPRTESILVHDAADSSFGLHRKIVARKIAFDKILAAIHFALRNHDTTRIHTCYLDRARNKTSLISSIYPRGNFLFTYASRLYTNDIQSYFPVCFDSPRFQEEFRFRVEGRNTWNYNRTTR